MTKIAVIYHSGFGHTKRQAEAVLHGAQSVADISARLYTTDEAASHLDDLDAFDGIIFGCPTYMGSMSASMKTFIEAAAKKWFSQAWKDKIAGAFTNSSSYSGDKLNTLTSLFINAMQHGMIYVGLGMMPAASNPETYNTINGPGPDVHNRVGSFAGPMSTSFQLKPTEAPSQGDLETAEAYGKRVAEITLRFVRGKKG